MAPYWYRVLKRELATPRMRLAGTGKLPVPVHEMKGLKRLDGTEFDASVLRGKVVLVTNVASRCVYTSVNYDQLSRLDAEFPGLEVVAVPSDDFDQEPGDAKEIQGVCELHHANFSILEKSDINGGNRSMLFAALARATGTEEIAVTWNFETKFLVAADGVTVERFKNAYYPKNLRPFVVELLEAAAAPAPQPPVSASA